MGEAESLIGITILGAAGFFSRGAWMQWLKLAWTLALAAIHAPVYAHLTEMEKTLTGKMDYQYRVVREELHQLRENGQAFSDRVNNMDRRINQAAEEMENLREMVNSR